MTEDDTFQALRRLSYESMDAIIDAWVVDDTDNRSMGEVLIAHNWTRELWHREFTLRNKTKAKIKHVRNL